MEIRKTRSKGKGSGYEKCGQKYPTLKSQVGREALFQETGKIGVAMRGSAEKKYFSEQTGKKTLFPSLYRRSFSLSLFVL